MNFIKVFTISIMALIIFTSCSGGAKTPVTNEPSLPNIIDSLGVPVDEANRDVLAVYDAVIDLDAKTFTVTPVQRVGTYHFPLSKYFPNVLQITGYGFTPNFWADIKLSHPYPGSGIDAFDPRVIAILPARPGVSFIYPSLGVGGNNKALYDPDGYTKLFDNLGGAIPGNVNPFKSYFKDQPYRVWSSTGVTSETQRWQMNLSGFGGPMQYKLVVDVSTNYPNPPQPVFDNAPEPVGIDASYASLPPAGGSVEIEVTLIDWQGVSEITGVFIESPDLFNGVINIPYQEPGPDQCEYVYIGTINNDLLPPVCEYCFLIATADQTSGIYLYREFPIYVEVEIQFNPVIVKTVDTHDAIDVYISGDYAYVADNQAGLQIIDIDPPEFAYIAKTVDTPYQAWDVHVASGYAYVADLVDGLQIIDIDPLESAYILKAVHTPGYAEGVYVSGSYAYVADEFAGMQIIDIEPPEFADIVKTVNTPGHADHVHVSGGYAYIGQEYGGLQIIDIEPLEYAHIVKTIDTDDDTDAYVSDGYAYVSQWGPLLIIDIEPPEFTYIVKTIYGVGYGHVYISSGYAYVGGVGILRIIDIKPLESAHIVTSIFAGLSGHTGVYVSSNYAYVTTSKGLKIIKLW